MSGHALIWRAGQITLLYLSQPMWAILPLAAGGFLGIVPLELFGLWRGLLLLLALMAWAVLTTGTAILVSPARVRSVFFFWGLPVWVRGLPPGCTVEEDGGFDYDEVAICCEGEVISIVTPIGGTATLADELRCALRRAHTRADLAHVAGS